MTSADNLPVQSEKKEITQIQALRSFLNSPGVKSRFEEMLGKQSASFLSSVVSAVSTNKSLATCEPGSVVASAAVAASLNLPINPSLGFAHIVPYKGVAQFQLGWKGFVQLALRSGQYGTINVVPVLEGQIKKRNSFTGEIEFSEEFVSRKVVGYLLFFRLLNGYQKYFYMSEDECRNHGKKYSASFKKGYGLWVDNFEAMALKTVVKLGLSKYGILSVEMQKAIELDQAVIQEDGTTFFVDNDNQESQENNDDSDTKTVSLADKLKEQQRQVEATKAPEPETPIVTMKTVTPIVPKAEEKRVEPVKKERTTMETMAGQMKITCLVQYKDMRIKDIPEEELFEVLSVADQQTGLSDDFKLFYSNACVWLGRKASLR